MSVIRAFIAVNLSPEIISRVGEISEKLQQQCRGVPVRWVPVENMHLTLKFLGDVSVSNVEILQKILKKVGASHDSCEISAGGVGAYPKIQKPRVLWIGLEAPQELYALQNAIDGETEKLGYPREGRPFSPHLTIGRVQKNATKQEIARLADVLEASNIGFLGATRIQEVHLYRSDLRPGGAKYTSLFAAPLREASNVN
jgi:2'-5' RNA ligase